MRCFTLREYNVRSKLAEMFELINYVIKIYAFIYLEDEIKFVTFNF